MMELTEKTFTDKTYMRTTVELNEGWHASSPELDVCISCAEGNIKSGKDKKRRLRKTVVKPDT